MNKENQRIAIAKACGWTNITSDFYGTVPNADELDSQGALENLYQIPDYLNDLNVIHGAEKVLTKSEYSSPLGTAAFEDDSFAGWLHRIMVRRAEAPNFRIYSASAAQRAEAFLRTLNLWEE